MPNITLYVKDISKSFNRREVLSNISFSLAQTQSLTITGKNGSGKSTLLKILGGILSASKGRIEIECDEKMLSPLHHHAMIGFVAPYLQLYDEFSAFENLEIIQQIRGIRSTKTELYALLDRVGLQRRGNDLLREYSSGMKQRVKYAVAIAHRPTILLLDEPSANLDEEGKGMVYELARNQRSDAVLIIATNEVDEIGLCEQVVHLGLETTSSSKRA